MSPKKFLKGCVLVMLKKFQSFTATDKHEFTIRVPTPTVRKLILHCKGLLN